MSSGNHTEVAIVGAGIVGLAHALAIAKRGHKVVVFERHPLAIGASIRNFGMIWPIGQPAGFLLQRALRSRAIWLEVAEQAGFPVKTGGSLHLAYREDELAVLQEFVDSVQDGGYQAELLTPAQVAAKSPAAITDGLLAALWSATEVTVDPREAIAKLPGLLTEKYGVEFRFGTVVSEVSYPKFIAGGEVWTADRLFLCSGADIETLYPALYQTSGITKVKLQMMRTAPQPNQWELGPCLCGGLTLTHYGAFSHCPALDRLKQRIATETPHFPKWGIHVMVSQTSRGELTLGDSHEYGLNLSPFDRADINRYVLDYLFQFARFPAPEIAETWHGIYTKLPGKTEWIVQPERGVILVNALGGAGMTLSFGLAEEMVETYLN